MTRNVVVLLDNTEGKNLVKKACNERCFILNSRSWCRPRSSRPEGAGPAMWDAFDDILDRIKENG